MTVVPAVLQVAGVVVLVVMGFAVSAFVGGVALGLALLSVGVLLDSPVRDRGPA